MAVRLQDIEPLRPLLQRRPLGLLSDIDSTLAPIVPNPDEARVSPSCRALLRQLARRRVRIALITGRELLKARAVAGIKDAVYAANHGLTVWADGRLETPEALREYTARARQVIEEVSGLGAQGVVIEEKGPALAFHYRQAVDEGKARAAIAAAIGASEAARAFRVTEGRKVIELRPPLAIDKGTALAGLVARLGVQAVICMGDDQTDIDMFRGVDQLRRGGLPGVTVAVNSEEATSELLAAADYWVQGVPGVEWLLRELLRALPGRRPSSLGTASPASR